MKKCDIIIPIYNAYDCVVECIESVIKNTDLKNNCLVLIDDKSTDKRIKILLENYKNKYPNLVVLFNKVNLGFVGTVNRGMHYSDHDVLLLNSDTEVTKNWLDKIQKCAYSGEKIATVTPLSNNATLASVPKSFVPNDIPKGLSLEEMAELVEKCSKREYPEIPTGHGFCLYIKRDVLNEVGYFDEETYGRGYGEENDFCFRALNKGYRHLLCDDTYIYHKESQSFAEDKKELIESGLEELKKKYPIYKDRLDAWCVNNPIKNISMNVALNLEKRKGRTNILYIIHDWKESNLGGTTLHAMDLIKNMRSKYNFHVLTLEDNWYKLYSYWEDNETIIQFPSVNEFHMLKFYNFEYKKMLENIIDTFGISIIHIHHLIGHYFDIADIIKERKIYAILTLHDYFCACPLINKIYKNQNYCNKPSEKKCNECLAYVLKESVDICSWRKEWKKLFSVVNQIIAPSESAKEEVKKTYPNLSISVIEHGINITKSPAKYIESKRKYNIAFIGAIGNHKGSKLLEELITYKKLNNITIHLFGIFDSKLQESTSHFINHGRYERSELKNILEENHIDLICLFSIWPETYSYTLTEAIACGIPVISYNMGAIAERLKKFKLGWTIPYPSEAGQVVDRINQILSNTEEYNTIVDSINLYKIKSVKEMVREYIKIYDGHGKNLEIDVDKIQDYIKRNSYFYNSTIVVDNSAWILNTLKWKIMSKIKVPPFIKKAVKKIIK